MKKSFYIKTKKDKIIVGKKRGIVAEPIATKIKAIVTTNQRLIKGGR